MLIAVEKCVEDYFTDIIQKKSQTYSFAYWFQFHCEKMEYLYSDDQRKWVALVNQIRTCFFLFFWMQYASVNRLWAVCWHVIWGSSDCNREDAILTIDLLNPCHRIRCNAVINVLYMFGWNNRSWQFAGKSWSRSHLLSDEFHTTEMFLQHAARLMRPSHLILSVWWEKSPGDPDSDLCILYTLHGVI